MKSILKFLTLFLSIFCSTLYAQSDKKVVIVHLRGGLDPLATVQPMTYPLKQRRHYLYREGGEILLLPDRYGFVTEGVHSSFPELLSAYNDGEATIVHRVGTASGTTSEANGYDLTSRGVATPQSSDRRGWIQRLAQNNGFAVNHVVDLNAESRATMGGTYESVKFYGTENVTYYERDDSRDLPFRLDTAYSLTAPITANNTAIANMQRASQTHSATSESIRDAISYYGLPSTGSGNYDNNTFGYRFREAEFFIRRTKAKIVYFEVDGFDTYADQRRRLESQLDDLSDNLGIFRRNMKSAGAWNNVIVVVLTDGGRSIRQVGKEPEDGRIDRAYGVGSNFGGSSDVYVFGGSLNQGGKTLGGYSTAIITGPNFLQQEYHILDVYAEIIQALGYSPNSVLEPYARKRLHLF